MAKGGAYERHLSKTLSLWWTGGEHDDCFWRSSQSGGRATVRRRKGKGTRGHCGDICATDSTGEPLTQLITIEAKKGYNKAHLGQLVDRPKNINQQEFEGFIEQARTAAANAQTPFWCVIHRRQQREDCIYFPKRLFDLLEGMGNTYGSPFAYFSIKIKTQDKSWRGVDFVAMTFRQFLDGTDPQDIRILLQRLRKVFLGV